MSRFSFWVCYLPSKDNTGFSIQLHDPQNFFTILFNAFKKSKLLESYSSDKIKIASRTDRGVGALMQIVSVNCSKVPILGEINSFLPDNIRVIASTEVSNDFNPRKDAISRTYSYFLYSKGLNLEKSQKILDMIKGTHDFRNFSKNDKKNPQNTRKTIIDASIVMLGEKMYKITITGGSFLWQQVRRIIGHLTYASENSISLDYTSQLLNAETMPKPTPAPPYYLVLEKIDYEGLNFNPDRKTLLRLSQALEMKLRDLLSEEMVIGHFKSSFEGLLG